MQESSRTMTVLLQTLLNQTPYLLVLMVGLGVAVAMSGRCRGAAIVTISGIIVQLLALLLSVVVQVVMLQGPPANMAARASITGVAFILINTIRAAGMGAVIVAVFMGRPAAADGKSASQA